MAKISPFRDLLPSLPDLSAEALADLKPELKAYLEALSKSITSIDTSEQMFTYAARVTTNSDVSIANNVDTAVTFTETRYDNGGLWDPDTPTRLTVVYSGFYMIGASVRWEPNATGNRRIAIQKNAANYQALDLVGATALDHDHTIATGVYFDEGDYVELAVLQTSGGNLLIRQNPDYSPELWVAHIGFLPETAFSV